MRHASRGRTNRLAVHGLNRIYNYDLGLDTLHHLFNAFQAGITKQLKLIRKLTDSLCTHFYLLKRFFPRYIQYLSGICQISADLQQKRRFSNSRIATHQYQRAWNNAASQHSVQFLISRFDPLFSLHVNL